MLSALLAHKKNPMTNETVNRDIVQKSFLIDTIIAWDWCLFRLDGQALSCTSLEQRHAPLS
jgi:hypothetical protein